MTKRRVSFVKWPWLSAIKPHSHDHALFLQHQLSDLSQTNRNDWEQIARRPVPACSNYKPFPMSSGQVDGKKSHDIFRPQYPGRLPFLARLVLMVLHGSNREMVQEMGSAGRRLRWGKETGWPGRFPGETLASRHRSIAWSGEKSPKTWCASSIEQLRCRAPQSATPKSFTTAASLAFLVLFPARFAGRRWSRKTSMAGACRFAPSPGIASKIGGMCRCMRFTARNKSRWSKTDFNNLELMQGSDLWVLNLILGSNLLVSCFAGKICE